MKDGIRALCATFAPIRKPQLGGSKFWALTPEFFNLQIKFDHGQNYLKLLPNCSCGHLDTTLSILNTNNPIKIWVSIDGGPKDPQ